MTIIGKRLSIAEFEELGRHGIFEEDDRVELIAGEVVTMPPVGGEHVEVVGLLTRATVRQLGNDYLVHVQSPIRLSTDGEPMPDLVIVRDRVYGDQLPTEADVLLVIEGADTTLRYDCTTKLVLYANAEIPEVWIVNLRADQIERYTAPHAGEYRQVVIAERGQTLTSAVLSELAVPVAAILR